MKILTILGTRPEIIRLSRIIPKLDDVCSHIVLHTGQNYDKNLNDIFFEQLELREPNILLNTKGTFGNQISGLFPEVEKILMKEKPDKVLILGDTNSGLSAIVARRMGIPVYHMEAGNRSYDYRVPEETNRRIIDHASDILMPYTEGSRRNLLNEGIHEKKIFVTGNPIFEVIEYYSKQIHSSKILSELSIKRKEYFLVTLHRAENVDNKYRLMSFLDSLRLLQSNYSIPVIISTHPRTKNQLSKLDIWEKNDQIKFLQPFGFFDFVSLEKNAACVLTDSGTVQEECSILKIPSVILRDTTERRETIECGSSILSGSNPDNILRSTKIALNNVPNWHPPQEYLVSGVSHTVIRIVLGYFQNT